MGDGSSRTDLSEQVPGHRAELRTFLIADIRGYTTFTSERGDEAAAKLASKFARVAREAVEGREGTVLELRGDEAVCVFVSPRQAVSAAIDLQDRLVEETAADTSLPLPAGIGLDVGEVVPIEGGYRGGALNMAARLCGIAKAGEVLASPEVIHLAGKLDSITYVERGAVSLKGLAVPVRVMMVVSDVQDHVAQLAPYAPIPSHPSRVRGPRWLPPVLAGRRGIALSLLVALVAFGSPFVLTRGGHGLAGIAGNSVGRIDPKSGRIVASMPVGNFPGHVAADADSVWVSNEGDDSISRVDPGTNAVVDTVTNVGHDPSGIAVGFGAVWVAASLDGTVARIDPQTHEQVGDPIRVGAGPDRLAVGDRKVWVTNVRDGSLVSIDPATDRVSEPIAVGLQPTGVAVGPDGAVWVTLFSENEVVRVDPSSGSVIPVPVGSGPNDVAVGDSGVWVVNSLADTVSHIDPTPPYTATTPIKTDPGPDAIALGTDAVWVSNEYGESVDRFDPSSGALSKRISIGDRAEGIAATDGGIYVASRETGRGHGGGAVLAEEPFSAPIDPAAGYSAALPPYLFDGLTAFKRVGGIESELVVPDLAESLPVPTDGGRTYTFQLRPGVLFSNGDPLRPEDVKASFERLFRVSDIQALSSYWAPTYFTGIVGADRCISDPSSCDLSHGITTDTQADTVTFHLTAPDVTFLTKLTVAWIVEAGTPARMLTRAPVPGTGPYMITSYRPGKGTDATTVRHSWGAARMVRNPHFQEWSKAARPAGFPNEIDWKFLVPSSIGTKDVEAGRADFAPVDDALAKQAKTFFPALVHELPVQLTWWIDLDADRPPFRDVLARQAIAYAMGRSAALGGEDVGTPTCQLTPPGFPGYQPDSCQYASSSDPTSPPDMEEAQRLVIRSGTKGDPITYGVCCQQAAAPTRYLGSVLRQLGYQVTIDRSSTTPTDQLDVFWGGFYPDFQFGSAYLGGICSFFDAFFDHICGTRVNREVGRAIRVEHGSLSDSIHLWTDIDRDIVRRASAIPVYSVAAALLISSARVHSFQVATNGVIYKDQFWVN